jgi:hypothetical protein
MAAKPTLGRIVHFYTKTAGPFAAIVTQVAPDAAHVALKIFPPHGPPYDGLQVRELSEDAEIQKSREYCWVWPPREGVA